MVRRFSPICGVSISALITRPKRGPRERDPLISAAGPLIFLRKKWDWRGLFVAFSNKTLVLIASVHNEI